MSDNKKRYNKKKIITAAAVLLSFVLLGVLCCLLLGHPELFDPEREAADKENRIDIYNYFYEADFSKKLEDYDDYETYLGYDRYVHVKEGNLTEAVLDTNIGSFGEEVLFFTKYFDIIIAGDCEEYNKLFTAEYYKSHGEKEPFTPQMLYDILIEKLSVTTENQITTCAFDVSYKIFENNGTFRDDIYSDASKTLYIEIDNSEGEYKISAVKYYVAD